jgi:hypothetical protein
MFNTNKISTKPVTLTIVWIGLILSMLQLQAQAKAPEALTDLDQALQQGKKEGKMVFIHMGRKACGNCQALEGYLASGEVKLSKTQFVHLSLNCDDPKQHQAFAQKFKVTGETLPFVVIAGPDGQQLAAHSGYGTPKEFEDLIKDARRKLPKVAAGAKTLTPSPSGRR